MINCGKNIPQMIVSLLRKASEKTVPEVVPQEEAPMKAPMIASMVAPMAASMAAPTITPMSASLTKFATEPLVNTQQEGAELGKASDSVRQQPEKEEGGERSMSAVSAADTCHQTQDMKALNKAHLEKDSNLPQWAASRSTSSTRIARRSRCSAR